MVSPLWRTDWLALKSKTYSNMWTQQLQSDCYIQENGQYRFTKNLHGMFTVALFITAPKGKHPKCPSTDEWTGLLWWLRESACQCRRQGFYPWSWRIPHVSGQLSPYTTTTGSVLQSLGAANTDPTCHNHWSLGILESVFCNKRSHYNEKTAHHN